MYRANGIKLAVLAAAFSAIAGSQDARAQWTWTPQTGRWINVENLPKETPELQVEHTRRLMLEGDYKKALRETNKFDKFYGDTELADENQFLRGEIRMAQGKLLQAAKAFQQVVDNYPDTDLYGDVTAKQYQIADRLYEEGRQRLEKRWRLFKERPLKHAIEVYSMVIQNEPFTEAAAEAQYKVGLCEFACEQYTTAAYDYRRVIEDYPDSNWIDEAGYGLVKCYYGASLPSLYDQTPSELAVSAADDFKERFPAEDRVEEVEQIRAEMREKMALQRLNIARFYEERREFGAARIYYQVVTEKFEDTEAADRARQWLNENPSTDELPAATRLAGGVK